MTAYGRASLMTPAGRWVVEVHSVNRKQLDMNVSVPREMLSFDMDLRKWVSAQVHRGQVTVRVHVSEEALALQNLELLKGLKVGWEKVAVALGYDPKQTVTLPFLAEQLEHSSSQRLIEKEDAVKEQLEKITLEALSLLMAMKEKEGAALARDLQKCLSAIEALLVQVEKRAPETMARSRSEDAAEPQVLDINEEIVRLHSHIKQFRDVLGSAEKSVGKTLDFIVQEMHREVNTISAKCADVELVSLCVKVKSEVEKIREQVQNIE